MRELDRARTVNKSIAVPHEGGGTGRKAHGHLVMACFGAGVAYGSSGIDTAGFGGRARSRENGFEKSGFTALERAHPRDAPCTSGTSDVLSHSPPPWLELGP